VQAALRKIYKNWVLLAIAMKILLIIIAAKYLIALPIVIAGILLFTAWPTVRKQAVTFGAIAGILSYATAKVAGLLYFDARPFVVSHVAPLIPHAADNGFPSDHTLLAAVIAAVITKYNWRLGIILWILALLIGATRVLADLHHPIDILGSLVIAGLVTWFTFSEIGKRINV
jgi:undecaprenyl-diphosphatase